MDKNKKNNENELEKKTLIAEEVETDSEIDSMQDSLEQYREEEFKRIMPVIPLRGLSVFPNMVLHFDIGREKSITALEKAMMMNQTVFLTSQKDPDTELPTKEDFYHIGTVAKIKQMLRLPGDTIRVLVEGICRGEIEEFISEVPYFKCQIREIEEIEYEELPPNLIALMRSVLASFEDYLELSTKISQDIFPSVASVAQPGRLADVITSHLEIKIEEKQSILEAFDVEVRLELLGKILSKEIEILNIENDINNRVRKQINKSQREYYLREQMKIIQEELGGQEEIEDEVLDWLRQLKKLKLPTKISVKVEKEIKRLQKMQASSAEGAVIRTYVETILALPWNKISKDNKDLKLAQKILDEDHYGLAKVKERVMEYLAVMQLAGNLKAPILCLVGPPGTGKTSIAKSIARALDRNFVRMSLVELGMRPRLEGIEELI